MKRGTTLMALEVETGAHEPDRSPSRAPSEGPRGTHASKSPGAGTSDAAGPIPALNADRDVQDHAAQTAVSTDLSSSGPPGRRAGGEGPGTRPPEPPRRPNQGDGTDTAGGGAKPLAGFVLRSSEVTEGGTLPKDYTGDGSAATLPLEWTGAPSGTRSFALIMHHVAPDMTKWYWVLYNIPADVSSLAKNVKGIGTLGNNSVNGELAYAPPHSKGPGEKKYTYTLYALSAAPKITVPAEEVSRDVVLAAMRDSILASAELNVIYSRGEQAAEGKPAPRPDEDGPPRPKTSPRSGPPEYGAGGEEQEPRRSKRKPPQDDPQRKPTDERKPMDDPKEPDGVETHCCAQLRFT